MRALVAVLLLVLPFSITVGDPVSSLTSGSQYRQFTVKEKLAYVSAVMDSIHALTHDDNMIDSLDECTGDMTLGQMTAIVDKYIDEVPQFWNRSASGLVIAAFIVEENCDKLMPLLPPVG
jgi:hypothetical protein